MKLTEEEINEFKAPFLRRFIIRLNELVGDKWNIVFRIHNIQKGDKTNIIDLAIKRYCVIMTAHGVNTTKTKPQTYID